VRLAIKLKLCHDKTIPLDYRSMLLAYFKNSFARIEYQQKLYLWQDGSQNNHLRPFTFSVYLPRPKFDKEEIRLESDIITVNFSTNDFETAIMLYNGLLANKDKPFTYKDDYQIQVETIHLNRQEKLIARDEAVFKTLSPVVVKESDLTTNHDKFYSPADGQFFDLLNKNCIMKAEILLKKKLELTGFEAVNYKKIPVRLKGHFVEAYQGIYRLQGEPELLNLLYQVGLGAKNGYGFGLLEVVE